MERMLLVLLGVTVLLGVIALIQWSHARRDTTAEGTLEPDELTNDVRVVQEPVIYPQSTVAPALLDQLWYLTALYDQGTISEAEYIKQRQQLLDEL